MNRSLFRTRIKFCGFTRPGDVRLACELGVDGIGFVFAAKSSRRIAPEEARAMRQALAPLVDAVALFQDNSLEEVRDVVRQVRPSLLQFHGNEDDSFCRSFGLPYLKVVPMAEEMMAPHYLQLRFPGAAGFLLDGHGPGEAGGSGRTFDWTRIPRDMQKPYALAGGLTPENVFEAVTVATPWAVDVASGIEVQPGIKDGEKMQRFVEEVRRADCHSDASVEPC